MWFSTGGATPCSSPSPSQAMKRSLFLFLILGSAGIGTGVLASSYGRAMAAAPTVRQAAPHALPFSFLAVSAAASVALAPIALIDRD